MRNKIAAILMALCMAVSLLPVQAMAEGPAYSVGEDAATLKTGLEQTENGAGAGADKATNGAGGDADKTDGGTALLPVQVLAAGSGASTPSGTPLTQELIESKRGYTKDEGIQLPAGDYYLTDNVYLVGDDAGAWSLLLSSSGNFTLDLNGYVLDLRGANILAFGNLTLKDSSTGGQPHKFRVEESGLWVWDETNGTETVTGGVITGGVGATMDGGSFGGGVYTRSKTEFTMKGGSIVGCTASFGGGVYMMGGDSTFTMEGGHIVGCTAGKNGGGVDVDNNSGSRYITKFTMEGGSVEDCTAANGGGVYTQSNTEFTMEDGSIQNCTAIETGGGVYGASTFTMTNGSIRNCAATNGGGGVYVGGADTSTMEGGSIVGCTAANGGGVYVGDAGFTMTNGSIQNCIATQAGGGVFVVKDKESCFTMNNGSRIENCKAGGVPNAVHADGTFENHTGIEKSLLSGINGGQTGAEDDPILIGSAEGLKDFRDKVNGGKTALCARLLCDIVLNDGTFDKDGNYTQSASVGAANVWTPIGTDEKLYSGTFDGDGYTIKGLSVKAPVENAGLFGQTQGATIKNVAVTGYVSGTTSGGIVGSAAGNTRIQNCANTGYVNGTTSGGIVGSAANSTVSGCLNTGAVTGTANAGGIAGRNDGGSIASSFYLTGTAANAVGENTGGTVTSAEAKTRTQFANELLPLLQNGDNNSPWTEYGYNRSLKMTLPLLKGQTADAHEHDYNVSNSDNTYHWTECDCGVIYDKTGHTGGTATCSEKATCEVCGAEYGEKDATKHSDLKRVEAKAATTSAEGNIEYWYCAGCGKYYKDAAARQEIKQADTVTAKLPSGGGSSSYRPAVETSARTADDSHAALWYAAMVIAALGAAAVVRRKKAE